MSGGRSKQTGEAPRERLGAEQSLQASEQRYRSLFEHMAEGYAHWVLFTSGFASDATAGRAVPEKLTHFIAKPCTVASPMREVREVLEGN